MKQIIIAVVFMYTFCQCHCYSYYNYENEQENPENEEAFYRPLRLSGSIFDRMDTLSQVLQTAQQHNCRRNGDRCSWNPADNMQCCFNSLCKCNLMGLCKCEPHKSLFRKK